MLTITEPKSDVEHKIFMMLHMIAATCTYLDSMTTETEPHLSASMQSRIKEVMNAGRIPGSRRIAFVSVVGSHNYGLADERSDIDLKLTYAPSLGDFFTGKFPTPELKETGLEISMSSIHEYRRHMFSGTINRFEPLFADLIWIHPAYRDFWETMRRLVEMNVARLVPAQYYRAKNAYKRLDGLEARAPERQWMFDACGYDCKEAAKAIRFLVFLQDLAYSGGINIRPKVLGATILLIKAGKMSRPEFESIYRDLLEMVESLVWSPSFKGEVKGSKPALSDLIKDMDGTRTPDYRMLIKLSEDQLFKAIQSEWQYERAVTGPWVPLKKAAG